MVQSRTEQMVRRLRDLQQTEGVEASAVVSVDGLIMASALPTDVEEDRVSAMSAVSWGAAPSTRFIFGGMMGMCCLYQSGRKRF